jgi:hypothetical protein
MTTQTQVDTVEASFHPYAECEECDWALPPSRYTTKADCTAHVRKTGHRVRRIRQTVTTYYQRTEAS